MSVTLYWLDGKAPAHECFMFNITDDRNITTAMTACFMCCIDDFILNFEEKRKHAM